MDPQEAVAIIESFGCAETYLHGDHYSFDTRDFVAWCAETGTEIGQEEANHILDQCCNKVPGPSGPVYFWRYYIT
jgi:hypothetical protein